ncbi:hypothetical protein BGZ58_003373, partial [Dissophora ornata]
LRHMTMKKTTRKRTMCTRPRSIGRSIGEAPERRTAPRQLQRLAGANEEGKAAATSMMTTTTPATVRRTSSPCAEKGKLTTRFSTSRQQSLQSENVDLGQRHG